MVHVRRSTVFIGANGNEKYLNEWNIERNYSCYKMWVMPFCTHSEWVFAYVHNTVAAREHKREINFICVKFLDWIRWQHRTWRQTRITKSPDITNWREENLPNTIWMFSDRTKWMAKMLAFNAWNCSSTSKTASVHVPFKSLSCTRERAYIQKPL